MKPRSDWLVMVSAGSSARIRTGHAGVLLLENRRPRLLCWDVAPDGPDFRLAP